MKGFLTLIVFLLFSFSLSAQNWADSGATWYYSYGNILTQGYVKVEYVQDTVIQGITSNKLKLNIYGINMSNGEFFENAMQDEYTFSDSDHVFIKINNEFKILYDFSAEIGDTLTNYLPHQLINPLCDSIGRSIVSATGTEVINNQSLRWYEMVYLDGVASFYGKVYEKIGSLKFMFPINSLCEMNNDFFSPLRCYSDDNFENFQNPNYSEDCDYILIEIPNYFSNNPEWCVNYAWGFGDECSDFIEEVEYINDVVEIDSVLYFEIYKRGIHAGGGEFPYCAFTSTFNSFKCFVRQEDRKIYYKYNAAAEDYLLYDFSLTVGDTLKSESGFYGNGIFPEYLGPYIITSIDSIWVDNNFYKRFYFSTPNGQIGEYEPDYIIEGIGHHRGFIAPYDYFFENYYYLNAFKKSDIIFYEFPEPLGYCDFSISIDEPEINDLKIIVYPNPAQDKLHIQVADDIQLKSISVYSISGLMLKDITPQDSNDQVIELKDLKSGMYLIKLISKEGTIAVKRFVKE